MIYNGVTINDTMLLVYNILFTFLLLLVLGVTVFAIRSCRSSDAKKQREIRKKLEEKAKTDPYAKKKLDKMNRKRNKSIKQEMFEKIFAFAVLTALSFTMLFFFFIPGWTDYVKKDYVVYEGTVTVTREYYRRHSYTYLDDGTCLTGRLGLDEGEHNVTIVYSKRTEIALDIID